MDGLISQLYDSKTTEQIKSLWKEDESSHHAILQAIGQKLTQRDSDNILLLSDTSTGTRSQAQGLNILILICASSGIATEETECLLIAALLFMVFRLPDSKYDRIEAITPSIQDQGLKCSAKTLLCLSLFMAHMEKRWRTRAKPRADYYRKTSQLQLQISSGSFSKSARYAAAAHHQRWESFLAEHLV